MYDVYRQRDKTEILRAKWQNWPGSGGLWGGRGRRRLSRRRGVEFGVLDKFESLGERRGRVEKRRRCRFGLRTLHHFFVRRYLYHKAILLLCSSFPLFAFHFGTAFSFCFRFFFAAIFSDFLALNTHYFLINPARTGPARAASLNV